MMISYFISNFFGADYAYFNRNLQYNDDFLFDHEVWEWQAKVLHFLIYVVSLPSHMIIFVLIIVKSDHDIIQGINKLDYLLKVSIFQMYKCDYHHYKLGIYGVMFRDIQKCHDQALLCHKETTFEERQENT